MGDKTVGFIIGIAAVFVVVAFMGAASAHLGEAQNSGVGETATVTGNYPMGSHMGMMGSMMHGMDMEGMDCMGLSTDEMDADNDGVCDYCGMNVELCEQMKGMHGSLDTDFHENMHEAMHGEGSAAGCTMMG